MTIDDHYEEVASKYESFWFYENGTPYQNFGVQNIMDIGRIKPSTKIVDIGAGTCNFSRSLMRTACLSNPIVCVEPSKELLEEGIQDTYIDHVEEDETLNVDHWSSSVGSKSEKKFHDRGDFEIVIEDSEVIGLCTDALQFVQYCKDKMKYTTNTTSKVSDQLNFDCILMKEVIHHIEPTENLDKLFSDLFDLLLAIREWNLSRHAIMNPYTNNTVNASLENAGTVLIVTRPSNSHHIPFFSKAHIAWAKAQLDSSIYVEALERAGFEVKIEERSFQVEMTLRRWLDMLKLRFWSNLAEFTEEELQKGINEVKEMFLQKSILASNNNLVIDSGKSCDTSTMDEVKEVVFPDKILYIIGTCRGK